MERGTDGEPPAPSTPTDALIEDEEQNGKQKKEPKEKLGTDPQRRREEVPGKRKL